MMKKRGTHFLLSLVLLGLFACGKNDKSDAYGNFEATSVTVSAKGSGELVQFKVEEGMVLKANSVVGLIDTVQLHLEKLQLEARLEALDDKLNDAAPEIAILLEKKRNMERERERTKALIAAKAATQKQLDDYDGEIQVIDQQITSTKRQISIANRSILSERKPLEAQIKVLENRIKDHQVTNPIEGVVLSKFVEPAEFVMQGAPLYKIANLNTLKVKAYASATLLQQVKLNDKVTVLVDDGKENYRQLEGVISWIASEAEFTPKTIETKEERVNLVYALDVKVKNDGSLKIGMPAEVVFQSKSAE
ncbi:HlyD family efflux transporter periplasmic adaptor subunit [Limibacter armeniacum]|uniref:HlyD family secretion protein n=1 Tax=Limibacter armeniacum TaxID=466084 RepID=UPI002FE59E8E